MLREKILSYNDTNDWVSVIANFLKCDLWFIYL